MHCGYFAALHEGASPATHSAVCAGTPCSDLTGSKHPPASILYCWSWGTVRCPHLVRLTHLFGLAFREALSTGRCPKLSTRQHHDVDRSNLDTLLSEVVAGAARSVRPSLTDPVRGRSRLTDYPSPHDPLNVSHPPRGSTSSVSGFL